MLKKIIMMSLVASSSLLAETSVMVGSTVGLKVGTLGLGLEYSKNYNDSLKARIGINSYNYSTSGKESDVDYDIDMKLQTIALLADYYPTSTGFRLSAGGMLNNNKLTYDAKVNQSVTINNVVYSASDVGSLKGDVSFNSLAPYLGLGYSSNSKESGFTFTTELGVLFQGTPKSDLTVTCGTGLNTAQCTALKADVAAEKSELDAELKDFDMYPVLSFGVGYRF